MEVNKWKRSLSTLAHAWTERRTRWLTITLLIVCVAASIGASVWLLVADPAPSATLQGAQDPAVEDSVTPAQNLLDALQNRPRADLGSLRSPFQAVVDSVPAAR